MILVAVAPSVIWPKKRPVLPPPGRTDTATVTQQDSTAARPPAAPAPRPQSNPVAPAPAPPAGPADTVWVTSPLYRLGFSTRGGQLVSAELVHYRSFAKGDPSSRVQLVPTGRPFLVTGAGDISLADWNFTPSAKQVDVTAAPAELTLTADRGSSVVTLAYHFTPDDYRFEVRGTVSGQGQVGGTLKLALGDGLRTVEADTLDDYRHFAVVTKAAKTESRAFAAIKPGEVRDLKGPFEWVALKSKYFLFAVLAIDEAQSPFYEAVITGGQRSGKIAPTAPVAVTLPVPPGGARMGRGRPRSSFEHRRLAHIGHDLDDANPYGGFLRPIVHPVSIFVVTILLWMHEQLGLQYGWVLVIFGVMIRVLLWPLNQKAMESSLRMQAVAPIIKDVQERYKGEPERLQREMMKVYKDHKISPLGGCLPMLIPFPVLIALFFVFQNTIEFRGVPFLWLPDLARMDPIYIIPILMGLSMFAVSKIGQKGVPPTPQSKMMLYFFPAMMTFLFFRFPSGLNLYYAVQNLVSIPQQYMLAKRRLAQQGAAKKS